MTTVVTGASGHVGYNVIQMMMDAGEEVRATGHRNLAPLEKLGVEQVSADILQPTTLAKAFEGAEHVLHLAAKISIIGDPDGSVMRINVEGTHNVARAAREAGARLVHLSSIHAFDLAKAHGTVDETSAKATRAGVPAYDRSKAFGEERVMQEVAKGLDATILNPGAIIGPGDLAPSRMGQVFLDLRARRLPALIGGSFDFVDVRDVAKALMAARSKGAAENHLLGGHYLSIRDLAAAAAEVTGVPAPRMTVPIWMAKLGVPFAKLKDRKDPKFTSESLEALRHGVKVDDRRARKVLGHDPRPLHTTIEDLYADFGT